MTTLARLQQWYSRQCNGEWEHTYGITIQSCDNPGWWMQVDLRGSSLEAVAFEGVAENVDANLLPAGPDWLYCHVSEFVWHGAGDETKLERILGIFLSWAESHGT